MILGLLELCRKYIVTSVIMKKKMETAFFPFFLQPLFSVSQDPEKRDYAGAQGRYSGLTKHPTNHQTASGGEPDT